MTLWQETLSTLIPIVAAKLAEAAEDDRQCSHLDWASQLDHRAISTAELLIYFANEHDARFTERPPHDYRVRLAGIQSTSTSGYRGALQNWKRAAEQKVAAAAVQPTRDIDAEAARLAEEQANAGGRHVYVRDHGHVYVPMKRQRNV